MLILEGILVIVLLYWNCIWTLTNTMTKIPSLIAHYYSTIPVHQYLNITILIIHFVNITYLKSKYPWLRLFILISVSGARTSIWVVYSDILKNWLDRIKYFREILMAKIKYRMSHFYCCNWISICSRGVYSSK